MDGHGDVPCGLRYSDPGAVRLAGWLTILRSLILSVVGFAFRPGGLRLRAVKNARSPSSHKAFLSDDGGCVHWKRPSAARVDKT